MGLDKRPLLVLLFIVSLFWRLQDISAQDKVEESQIKVGLRMIGHHILLNSGDSTSRVMPVIRENEKYRIRFESEFQFAPEQLVLTIDSVVTATGLSSRYLVEVQDEATSEVVYSFRMDSAERSDIVPCQGRIQPKANYSLLFTDLKMTAAGSDYYESTFTADQPKNEGLSKWIMAGLLLLTVALVILIFRRRGQSTAQDPHLIALGEYRFDKRNTELLIRQQKIELTAKEGDLLLLLYDSANSTVEREVILNRVWGDEGDYVGRTLDVFISKLRKKLEFDAKVKIVNIRGVGYKLVLDE